MRQDSCRLRVVERSDVARWRDWINRSDVMEGLDRALPVTEEEHERFIERNVAGNEHSVWFSIEAADGTYVGNIWLWDIHWRHRRAEVRIFVAHEEYAGRGIGREAVAKICNYAFSELGLHKLYAFIHEANDASRKAFEASGFSIEATLKEEAFRDGRFCDVFRVARISGRS